MGSAGRRSVSSCVVVLAVLFDVLLVQAPVLVDYWLENFRIHVEARSGALHLEARG